MIKTAFVILSIGCGACGARADETMTFSHQGIQRTATIHAPADLAAAPAPVVISLHGRGQSVASLRDSLHLDATADREHFIVVYPEALSRLRAAMEASGSFTNYATQFLTHHQVTEDFEVTPQIIQDFRDFLAAREIVPGVSEWIAEESFIENRLKTEIFDQALGVEKGDQIEAQRDPVILKAVEALGG